MQVKQVLNRVSRFVLLSFAIAGMLGAAPVMAQVTEGDGAIYEIRSYHIAPDQIENYKTWIGTYGLPHIREHMDVVGFWVKGDFEHDVSGAPMDELGSANVTWIIRWSSKEGRDRVMGEVFGSPEWREIFSKFPGGREAYLRTEIRYFEGL